VHLQSAQKGGSYLEERIEAFLDHYRGCLAALTEGEFEEAKNALEIAKLERDKVKNSESCFGFVTDVSTASLSFFFYYSSRFFLLLEFFLPFLFLKNHPTQTLCIIIYIILKCIL
jgi:hypothetical protein